MAAHNLEPLDTDVAGSASTAAERDRQPSSQLPTDIATVLRSLLHFGYSPCASVLNVSEIESAFATTQPEMNAGGNVSG